MIEVEEEKIDQITEAISRILNGENPAQIVLPRDYPDNEVRQVTEYFNKLIVEYNNYTKCIHSISNGDLEKDPPRSKMKIFQHFKHLQSNLRHLSFKTQQIAGGDFELKVDFIGDFSKAFNTMTLRLKEAFETIKRQNKQLQEDKLNALNDLVGELVIAKNIITDTSKQLLGSNSKIERELNTLGRISSELQDVAQSIRMLPMYFLFKRLERIVRDLSKSVNKKINFRHSGEDIEVDYIIIKKISDPLIQMIIYCVEQGVEETGERIRKKKTPTSQISIDAKNDAGEIQITIKDDGEGLDKEKIIKKAVDLGILNPDTSLLEEDIYSLILSKEFSSSELSEEMDGLGIDTIQESIGKIKGSVEIEGEKDVGTTFIVRAPQTLVTIQGMLVRVDGHFYTIPIDYITENLRLDNAKIVCTVDNNEFIELRDDVIPIVSLREMFDTKPQGEEVKIKIVVVVEHGKQKVAFLIDKLLYQYETVIKPLPNYFRHITGVMGCSILGSGDTSLILDPRAIFKQVTTMDDLSMN